MTNRQKYILDCDEDGHWYYFPVENKEDFEKWIDIQYDQEYDEPIPDWLNQIDGPSTLTFENPQET
jgi:hypothetical protein